MKNMMVSSPIIYDFFEAQLGRIIGEDDAIIIVDVLSQILYK